MSLRRKNLNETLAAINQKITEIKKKIQLSEGQRKAHFEECDAEKKKNVEKIRVLKKEIKEIYKRLAEPSFSEDVIFETVERMNRNVGVLRNKKMEDAIEFMDLKCIDLNKRLDVIKYRNKMKKIELKNLAEEYRDQTTIDTDQKMKKMETVSTKPICVLENQIHRVEMNMMEAEHVNKKYKTIRLHLLSDSVEFESSLRILEEEIRKQRAEIKHLEDINKEALGLRDVTKGTLLRHEISALNAGKTRENQLQDFRRRVEERKLELERLERRIFPAGRMVFEEGGEGAQIPSANESTSRTVVQLETYFAKLKVATGETETEKVLSRFLSQKETKERLDFLKRITEEEKNRLEHRKEASLVELEAFKFSEVKDKEESQEELEKIKEKIGNEKKLKESHEKEIKRTMNQLFSVRKTLFSFMRELQNMNEESAPDLSDDVGTYTDILLCLRRKIQSGLDRLGLGKCFGDVLKFLGKSQHQHFIADVSISLPNENDPLFSALTQLEEGKQTKVQPSLLVPETEDEEDVFSRVYLKRQAQLVVDSKSRKKFNRVLNFPKAKK